MPPKRFPGPCKICNQLDSTGRYWKHMCHNCYRKEKRKANPKPLGTPKKHDGPCNNCGSTTSSTGRYIKGLCYPCYRRLNNTGNSTPRKKFKGPCKVCNAYDSVKYVKGLCRACYRHEQQRLRRARIHSTRNDLQTHEWLAILDFYNYTCAYCGVALADDITMDHIVPLTKGGHHTASNVVPACRSCNSAKKDGPPPKEVPTYPFTQDNTA